MPGHIGYAADPVIRAPRSPDEQIPWHAHLTFGVSLEQALSAGTAPASEAVHVVINHGRWVVNCPTACGGAQLGCPTDRRFMCNECANIAIGGLWRPVVWPKDSAAIAALIVDRDDITNRNYEPGETVAELREQNRLLAEAVILEPTAQLQGDAFPENHTHSWPKRVDPDELYTCEGCGAVYDGAAIRAERKSS